MENPVKIANELYENYLAYIKTSIPVNKEYEEERNALYDKAGATSLMKSPIIELTNVYTGKHDIANICDKTTADFIKNGMFNKKNILLFNHQKDAVELARKQNVIVTTGTGSGKTECFMIPVIETMIHNILQNKTGDAIKTLILYPLNALAEDQLKRLRQTLERDECHNFYKQHNKKITFGRYTGQTPKTKKDAENNYKDAWSEIKPETSDDLKFSFPKKDEPRCEYMSKEEMLKNAPDILITNYSMLSVMLMRAQEDELFDKTKAWIEADEKNQFTIVIDELHSYRGTAGTEVAYILRNLIYRLGLNERSNQLRFIASSASLGDDEETATMQRNKFIKEFFNRNVDEFKIIADHDYQEKFIPLQPKDIFLPEDAIKELELYKEQPDLLTYTKACTFYEKYNLLNRLKSSVINNVCSIEDLQKRILPQGKEDLVEQLLVLLNRSVEIVDEKEKAKQPIRVHYFFKNISDLYVCSNNNCTQIDKTKHPNRLWGKLYATPITRCTCGGKVLPAVICRRCGEIFIAGYSYKDSNGKESELYIDQDQYEPQKMQVIYASLEEEKNKDVLDKGWKTVKYNNLGRFENDLSGKSYFLINNLDETAPGYQTTDMPTYCPHCGFEAKQNKDHMALPPLMRHITYVQKVNQVFADVLMNVQDDEKKKLVLFSDSRQQAAKLSCGIELDHYHDMLRIAIYKALNNDVKSKLKEFYDFSGDTNSEEYENMFAALDSLNLDDNARDVLDAIDKYKTNPRRAEKVKPTIDAYFSSLNTSLAAIVTDVETAMLKANMNPAGPEPTVNEDNSNSNNFKWTDHIDWSTFTLKGNTGNTDFDNATQRIDRKCRAEILHTIFGSGKRSFESLGLGYIHLAGVLETDSDFVDSVIRVYGESFRVYDSENTRQYDSMKDNAKPMNLWRYNNKVNNGEWFQNHPLLDNAIDILNNKNVFFNNQQRTIPVLDGNCVNLEFIQPNDDDDVYICPICGTLHLHKSSGICTFCFNRLELDKPIKYKEARKRESFYTKNLDSELTKLHCEELTGQTDIVDSLKRQRLFQNEIVGKEKESDKIDLLSVTTTMEAGVDIGSLSTVMLGNVPPQRFNYQQRVGRAGRRGSAMSIALTVAKNNSHDLTHYNQPERCVSGNPPCPYIDLRSKEILQRVIIQEVLRLAFKKIGKEHSDYQLGDNVHGQFGLIKTGDKDTPSGLKEDVDKWLNAYIEDNNSEITKIINVFTGDKEQKQKIHEELFTLDSQTGDYGLVKKIKEKVGNSEFIQQDLSERLAAAGLLPMFGFPTQVRYLYQDMPRDLKKVKGIDRDQLLALSTFAPGCENVKDKKLLRSVGFIGYYTYQGQTKETYGLRHVPGKLLTCKTCGYTTIIKDDKDYDKCPLCDKKRFTVWKNLRSPLGYYTDDNWSTNYNGRYEYNPTHAETKLDSKSTRIELKTNELLPNLMLGANIIPDNGVIRSFNTKNDKGFTVDTVPNSKVLYDIEEVCDKDDQGNYKPKINLQHVVGKTLSMDASNRKIVLVSSKVTGILECCINTQNPDININTLESIKNNGRYREIEAAITSWGFLVRKSITSFLDIKESELDVDFFVNDSNKLPGVYFMEQLINGAGYTNYLANSNGDSGMTPELQKKIFSDELINGDLYKFITSEKHMTNCDCSCYDCLRDFYNQKKHSIINWRLGLDIAHIIAENKIPDYTEKENYWNKLIENSLKQFEKLYPELNCNIDKTSNKNVYILSVDDKKYMLYHPLWSNSKVVKEHTASKADTDLCFTDFIKSLDLKSANIIGIDTTQGSNSNNSSNNSDTKSQVGKKEKIFPNDDFIDDKNTTSDWKYIFERIGQLCNTEQEKKNIKVLCEQSEKFENKEKPNWEGSYKSIKTKKDYPVDALWEDSEVMLFTTDKEESYNFALNTQYKCFYLDDENFNIDDLLEALENK